MTALALSPRLGVRFDGGTDRDAGNITVDATRVRSTATIDEIEVRGRFEGNLVVRKRLFIRATGRVSGTIRYGQLEIERGGQISGDIQSGDDAVSETPGARVAF
jgi:cytoskeletal protein CcmA (bactofilin family)